MSGILYVLATPIGNMGDITDRARDILAHVPTIAAEDTRTARKLLELLNISASGKRIVSYFEGNERRRTEEILDCLQEGDVALMSEAGTPAISDPGAVLVREALVRGFTVSPVPGPSALAAAVSVSGIGTRFTFMGFPPARGSQRRDYFEAVARSPIPVVIYESPHRLTATLDDLAASAGEDAEVVLCRELTKIHEEVTLSTVHELRERYATERPRGEIVLVVQPAPRKETSREGLPPIESEIERLRALGLPTKTIAAVLAPLYSMRKKDVYSLASRD